MIFKFAIKKKWIKDNPCTGSVIPKKRITIEDIEKMAIEDKYLETKEIHKFLEAVNEFGLDQDKDLFYLMVFTGM